MKKNKHTFVVLAYKESKFLEDCIKSVLNQTVETNVVIATSTPNDYIQKLAKKYDLKVIVNKGKKGIGADFDFALHAVKSELITIAHQDDIYDSNYAETVLNMYEKNKRTLILIPDYYEIRRDKNAYTNRNLKIKRILLFLLRFNSINHFRFVKRSALRMGNAICCPAVTFVQAKMPKEVFTCDLKCNIDWYGWEKISNLKGAFCYKKKSIMGHRIYDESTTTKIIGDNIRTKEDLYMLKKFWPEFIAKIINKFYKKAEESNNV